MSFKTQKQLHRRSVLQLGGGVLGGLGLSHLLEAQALSAQGGSTPDTSVIFVWLPGGPPHMETYDLKPDAPADYRGQVHLHLRPFRLQPLFKPKVDTCSTTSSCRHKKTIFSHPRCNTIVHNHPVFT